MTSEFPLKDETAIAKGCGGNPVRHEGWFDMRQQGPNYMDTLVQNTRDTFCDVLHNPNLWSEKIIKQTLQRTGSQPFNIEDVQMIVKDYLVVLSDTIRRGEEL